MFNNLIESSSHKSELKRRGSFILFTMVTYALLFVLAGIASVYSYDARLADQNLEVVTMFSPVDFPVPKPATPEQESATPRSNNPNRPMVDERRVAMLSVNTPQAAPTDISTKPNPNLPVRAYPYVISNVDRDANVGRPVGTSQEGGTRNQTETVVVDVAPPTPTPTPPVKIIKSSEVLNGKALILPKPLYPQMAREMHLQGKVSVQVLIDETGNVISAKALDGHALFKQVSERAAYQARFSPTILGQQPVKVSGVITYNFVMQ